MTRQRFLQIAELHGGVDDDDVGEIDRPAVEARARVGCAVGDAFHLLQNFLIEAAQKECACRGASLIPALFFADRIEFGGTARHVLRNFLGHQVAVLVAAVVGFAFNVEINPSADRIAIGGTVGGDGGGRGPSFRRIRGHVVQRYSGEPGFAIEGAAVGDGEHQVVLRAGGGEAEMHAGPIARAGDGFRLHIPRHGRHGEGGASGDGRAVEIADGELVGADPAGELVGFADGERNGGGLNASVAVSWAGFEAHGHLTS